MYRNGIKRLLAVVLSLCGMLCLSWLFLILAIAIKLDSPGPVFFKQKRVGRGKRHFYILKFRTMRIDTPHDMPTHLLHDPSSVRVPRCGTSTICWRSATNTGPTMCAPA